MHMQPILVLQAYIVSILHIRMLVYYVQVPDTHSTIIVTFVRQFEVDDPQQSPVSLYDYYDPGSYNHACMNYVH